MTKYLLDSDICIFAIRSKQRMIDRIAAVPASDWAISAVTAFEISKGIARQPGTRATFAAQKFLEEALILPVTVDVARRASDVHAFLSGSGRVVGIADELIAGHCLALKLALVSNNTKHFQGIPGLKLENWL